MKAFWDKLSFNPYYRQIFKNPFTYITGAILLSIFQIAIFTSTGSPWGMSGIFADRSAWLCRLVGGDADRWYYFSSKGAQSTLNAGIVNHPGSWQSFGIIAGTLAATLLASQFKFKKIGSLKQVVATTLEGLLMDCGACLAGRCNIGTLFSAIGSMSVSGWVFTFFLFIGAFIGSKLLAKFFM